MRHVREQQLGAEATLFDSCPGHILLAFAEGADREEMPVTNKWNNA